jgi:hypothetical protein
VLGSFGDPGCLLHSKTAWGRSKLHFWLALRGPIPTQPVEFIGKFMLEGLTG